MTLSTRLLTIEELPPHARWYPALARRPLRESEQTLSDTTRRWLRRLPPRQRPLRLCERFPRVANRIAWCWNDPLLTGQVMDDLLVDRRGGREGFPAAVVLELRRLRDLNDRVRAEEASAACCWVVGHPARS